MKRILLITFLVLLSVVLYSQNDYKYQVRAFGGLSVGGNYGTKYYPVKIDSITSNGTDIKFYSNGAILEATPGAGAASWGSITGLISSQTDLTTALGLKANIASPTFTGTVGGITAGMVGAMSTSHAANAITGTDITNWGTAYTNNLRWDGGNNSLVAATGRASLGGTTVGQSFFTLTNPSAITFPRINANNTVSALSAADLKTALSLTSSDVGLSNLTNKLQVEAEDSSGISSGNYMPRKSTANLVRDSIAALMGSVSRTELSYLNGVTSSIQAQINALSVASSASWNIVNVKDHGAVGNGTTPDADSINAQIADNTILFIPSGTYLIDTILRFTGLVNFKMIGENGTTFLINETTNSTENYGCILISGATENVEISKINFRITASDAEATQRPPIIYVGNNTASTTDLNINNCKFHAPSINMNAVYMLGNTGIYSNIYFNNNEVDSIGRCGIEYWENGYANATDSSSFHNVIIKDNHFSNTGLFGEFGMAISLAGNDVDISGNLIFNHRRNQAIEVGHSYRAKVINNTVNSFYASSDISGYLNYQFQVSNNILTAINYTAANIALNTCTDLIVANNVIKGYSYGMTLVSCTYGTVTGNYIRLNRGAGIWIDDGVSDMFVSGNKIDMIDATNQYGAIRISKSDNGAMTGTEDNIIQDNIITSGQAGLDVVVYNVNRSLNTVTEGSLIKTKTLTFGLTGNAQADQLFDITQANTTEQVLTFADVLPSNCRIIAFEMVCVTAVTGGTDVTIEVGTSSSGAELIVGASCNTLNEARGVIDAAKLPAIPLLWNESVDQYSFRSIYISATPAANWNTISAGKWIALMTYIDYRYK